jgi:hypothetical protein
MRGIFHQWKDGDNVIRLAGNFLEVRTHFIAPAKARNDRGLCRQDAFLKDGESSLPQVINCLDWDVEKEEPRAIKRCPICKLAEIAKAILKENPTDEEKKFADGLRQAASARSNLKWNIIDRDDPYIILTDNGTEKRVLGFKIATIGMEAWKDIEGIFEQCNRDISDPKLGIDVKVTKGSNGMRVVYSAQAVLDGVSLKVTPFTAEEAAMPMHDLKGLCGKTVEPQKIVDAMHEDLMQLYQLNIEEAGETGLEKEEEAAATAVVVEEAPFDDGGLSTAAPAEDGDGLMDGTKAQAPAPAPKPVAPKPVASAPVASKPAAPVASKPVAPVRPVTTAAPASTIKKPVGVPASIAQKKT